MRQFCINHDVELNALLKFAYPFTLEPHILTVESSRRSTIAAHNARHEAYLRQREEEKLRRRREALRRIAPGFEPASGPLLPTKLSKDADIPDGQRSSTSAFGHERQRSVMDDLVDHLAKLDSASSSTPSSSA